MYNSVCPFYLGWGEPVCSKSNLFHYYVLHSKNDSTSIDLGNLMKLFGFDLKLPFYLIASMFTIHTSRFLHRTWGDILQPGGQLETLGLVLKGVTVPNSFVTYQSLCPLLITVYELEDDCEAVVQASLLRAEALISSWYRRTRIEWSRHNTSIINLSFHLS